MNDFPWTPQHEQPAEPVKSATEEVVPDSGDQIPLVKEEAEVVVSEPAPKEPAAKKTAPKARVTKTRKAR
jgi:hypothetical protein